MEMTIILAKVSKRASIGYRDLDRMEYRSFLSISDRSATNQTRITLDMQSLIFPSFPSTENRDTRFRLGQASNHNLMPVAYHSICKAFFPRLGTSGLRKVF